MEPITGRYTRRTMGETVGITGCCFRFITGLATTTASWRITHGRIASPKPIWRRSRPSLRHGDESEQPATGPWQLLIGSPADLQHLGYCADAAVRLDLAAPGRQR